jgi:hypothetical protein
MFRLMLLACLGLYFVHFIILQGHAVNVPVGDEWDALDSQQLPAGLSLRWLYEQHNEHRIATTKLLIWALFHLNRWNLITHQTINFLIYGLLLFVVVRFAEKTVPQLDTWIVLSFMLFLLSPLNYENHSWGFQSTFHFSLLFFFSSVYFLYQEKQKWADLLLGSAMSILAIYSVSNGLIASVASLSIFSLFKFSRFIFAANAVERRRELRQVLMVVGIVGAALVLWFADYHQVQRHPSHVLPYRRSFWLYFSSVTGLGFGLDATSFLPGFFCLLLMIIPIGYEVWRKRGRLTSSSWAVYAAVAGTLATLGAITIGRANFGIEQSKSSRYSEIAMMLIPLSVLAWSILLEHKARLRRATLIFLWSFCFFTFLNNWSWFSKYEAQSKERMRGLSCIEKYYESGGEADCPTLYPWGPITKKLENARSLNISFYQYLEPHLATSQKMRWSVGLRQTHSIALINGEAMTQKAQAIINTGQDR